MAKLKNLHCLIIGRKNIREKDRVIEVFSYEEGRTRIFVPGVRHVSSRRAGHIETLMESKIVVAQSSRGYSLSEARVSKSFPLLRSDYDRLDAAFKIIKLLREHTNESQADIKLYDAIIASMERLNGADNPPDYVLDFAGAHILNSLGMLPDLYRCSQCRKELSVGNFSFMGINQGLRCKNCEGEKDPEITDTVKILRIFLRDNSTVPRLSVSSAQNKKLRGLINRLLLNHSGRL